MTITLNQDFKKSVSITDIKKVNSVIIDVLKPIYEGEKRQAKLGVKLGIAVADWVVLAMSGENTANTLPTLDQCKSHLKELIKTFVPQVENSKGELIPDAKEIAKLNSHVQDACKMALLIAGSNTGFIKGIRNESRADIVPLNQAFDKKGNLKNGLVEDIFWSPVATFPMRNDGTEKAPIVIKNSDVHRPCTINSVRESFGVHFEGKKLNAGRYALDKEESTRDKTEQGFVLTTPEGGLKVSGVKDAIQFLTNRFEDGDVEMMLVKDDTASKNCLNAIEQFIKTFQNKKLNAEQEIKSAIENEKAEIEMKKARIQKAS
jgi:hypothetical protein